MMNSLVARKKKFTSLEILTHYHDYRGLILKKIILEIKKSFVWKAVALLKEIKNFFK